MFVLFTCKCAKILARRPLLRSVVSSKYYIPRLSNQLERGKTLACHLIRNSPVTQTNKETAMIPIYQKIPEISDGK